MDRRPIAARPPVRRTFPTRCSVNISLGPRRIPRHRPCGSRKPDPDCPHDTKGQTRKQWITFFGHATHALLLGRAQLANNFFTCSIVSLTVNVEIGRHAPFGPVWWPRRRRRSARALSCLISVMSLGGRELGMRPAATTFRAASARRARRGFGRRGQARRDEAVRAAVALYHST